MKIDKIVTERETVLKLAGCLDTSAAAEFGSALEAAADAKTLVVDFSDLDFIASSGIRLLVSANKKAVQQGRLIALTGMNEVVADVFDVTGLNEVFEIR